MPLALLGWLPRDGVSLATIRGTTEIKMGSLVSLGFRTILDCRPGAIAGADIQPCHA